MTKPKKHIGIEERIGADGKISYRAKVRLKPYSDQSATFNRITDAIRWRQQTITDLKRGIYFQTIEAKKHTFFELVDKYIEIILPSKPKSIKKQTAQLVWWKKQIGNKLLSDITTSLIVEIRDKFVNGITYRGGKRSPATVNRYIAVLSHAFSVAVTKWQWLSESPIKSLKQKEASGRIRFLSNGERDRLLQACKESKNKYLYLIVLIALSTGLRHMEIMSLRYDDIKWENGNCIITIRESKNGHQHLIPLVGIAKQLLAEHSELRRLDTDLIFPATKGIKPRPAVIRAAWDEALEKANIKDFSFHCLRHTAASWLAQVNVNALTIQKILNHMSSNITSRYIHLAQNHLQEALEKMNEAFLSKELER